eukprot:TRINITY_DN12408_c0_g1_i2.p1 TRINITY_DN12408_c0_g1~~TRINITY_DN12408_c0_g1_i2.p1  ORF type:complete len:462 (+),score=76.80 TRINITY_DN12408_c0_g1_i2:816-2201(+)
MKPLGPLLSLAPWVDPLDGVTTDEQIVRQASRLSLGERGLGEIPNCIGQLTRLEKLWIHQNQLSALPQCIGDLTNLRVLDVGLNLLSSLGSTTSRLTKLEELYLGYNRFTSVPIQVEKFVGLTLLYLRGNPISELPRFITKLNKLSEVLIEANGQMSITRVPEGIKELPCWKNEAKPRHDMVFTIAESLRKMKFFGTRSRSASKSPKRNPVKEIGEGVWKEWASKQVQPSPTPVRLPSPIFLDRPTNFQLPKKVSPVVQKSPPKLVRGEDSDRSSASSQDSGDEDCNMSCQREDSEFHLFLQFPSLIGKSLRRVVLDGSNIAMSHGKGKRFSAQGMKIAYEYFAKCNVQVYLTIPSWRKSEILSKRKASRFEKEAMAFLSSANCLVESPQGAYEDDYVVDFARMKDAVVVSNDFYRDLKDPENVKFLKTRHTTFSFTKNDFQVTRQPDGRPAFITMMTISN